MERHESSTELGMICSDCVHEGFGENEPKTLYVHLLDGEIAAIEGVTGIGLTGTSIVVRRRAAPALTYSRSQVYFACCDKDRPPPSM